MAKKKDRVMRVCLWIVGAFMVSVFLFAAAHAAPVSVTVPGYIPYGFPWDSAQGIAARYDVSANAYTQSITHYTDTSVHTLSAIYTFDDDDWNAFSWLVWSGGDTVPVVTPRVLPFARERTGDTLTMITQWGFPDLTPDSVLRIALRNATVIGATKRWTADRWVVDTVSVTNDSLPLKWSYAAYTAGNIYWSDEIVYPVAYASDTVTDTLLLDTVVIAGGNCISDDDAVTPSYIVAYDSLTGNEVGIEGALITVRNAGGEGVGNTLTDDSGWVVANLKLGSTYTVYFYKSMYVYAQASVTIDSLGQVDTIFTSAFPIAVASTDKVCAVTIYARNNDGQPAEGVWINAYLNKSGITDSSGQSIANTPQRARTNSNGLATFYCLWTSYLLPEAVQWVFSGNSPTVGSFRVVTEVPRQSSYFLNLATAQ